MPCEYFEVCIILVAIAACMYPIPEEMIEKCNTILIDDLREISEQFSKTIS